MELFDAVNIRDEIIGTTDKTHAHTDGSIHRVVAVYVFTPDNLLYVQKHIKSGGLLDHSVGGHVRKDEGYDEAAIREGGEELDLTDTPQKLSVFYSDETFFGGNIKHMFGLFECHPSKEWKFTPNEEVKELIPMTIEKIVASMNTDPHSFTPGFLNTMREYLGQKQLPYQLRNF